MRYSCDASPGDTIEITVVEPTQLAQLMQATISEPTSVLFLEQSFLHLIHLPRSGFSNAYKQALAADRPTIEWTVPTAGRWFVDLLEDLSIQACRRTSDGKIIPMQRVR